MKENDIKRNDSILKDQSIVCAVGVMNMKFSICFILFSCVSGAFGQTNSSFYVATTGNDSNPGTQAAPWRTIQHAADTARAGSTVNVRGGTYEELVSINASGNASDGFITFQKLSRRNGGPGRDAFHSLW